MKKYICLSGPETLVMKCIWDSNKRMTIEDIQEAVYRQFQKKWKQRAVASFLKKIIKKGFLKATEENSIIFYDILIPEAEYAQQQSQRFTEFLKTDPFTKSLYTSHSKKPLTQEELEEINKMIDCLENSE